MEKENEPKKEKELRVLVFYGEKSLVDCMKAAICNHYCNNQVMHILLKGCILSVYMLLEG